MTCETLNLALIGLLSMGLAASGQPVNFEASDMVKPGSTSSSWVADTPAWNTSIDRAEIETRDLEVRPLGYESLHIRRAFVVGLGSSIVNSASWVFDMWVTNNIRGAQLDGRGLSSSINLHAATISVPRLRTITMTDGQFRGAATFRATGYVGTAELVIEFVAEVLATSAATIIQSMIRPPMATLAGASIPVTSWEFPGIDD